MFSTVKLLSIALVLLITNALQLLHAQDKLPWMDEYTLEMLIGKDTYQYAFTNVEGNDCKIKIEEQVTNKKGAKKTRSWIFYLSDMDASKLSFKAKGKALVIYMETYQSQKFITYFEEGKIDGYTQGIKISFNEVELARTCIETLKQRIENCELTQTIWENRDEAFTWLENNVGKASDKEVQWDQKFQQGSRLYLLDFETNSVNGKGEKEMSKYTIDLTDIDTSKMNIRIAGKSLILEMPVKEGKRLVKVNTPGETRFTDELLVYSDNIELARQTFNAFKYVITNTSYKRTEWESYKTSLGFVKDNLGEVRVGDNVILNSLNFNASPDGLVDLTILRSESEGSTEAIRYEFYLTDLLDEVKLEVSKNITLEMETKEKREYIRETKDGKVSDYASNLIFHVADIDQARDLINALEFAIRNSQEKIEEFSKINEIDTWFTEHVSAVEIDENDYQQNLSIDRENENQLIIEKKLVKSDGTSTETKFILYPEDISLDKLDIKVSGRKLFVPLMTGTNKYIKNFENSKIQNFTGSVEILFSDPLEAKNFMAAIRFLKEKTVGEDKTTMSKEEAIAFLSGNIQSIKLPDEQYEQLLEFRDEEDCKLSFTRVELNEKKPSIEYLYELAASDIHPGSSKLSIKGEIVSITLVTDGNEKLIKTYKNGEAGDFVDDFVIYADDVLVAKKTLAAFAALSEGCR